MGFDARALLDLFSELVGLKLYSGFRLAIAKKEKRITDSVRASICNLQGGDAAEAQMAHHNLFAFIRHGHPAQRTGAGSAYLPPSHQLKMSLTLTLSSMLPCLAGELAPCMGLSLQVGHWTFTHRP